MALPPPQIPDLRVGQRVRVITSSERTTTGMHVTWLDATVDAVSPVTGMVRVRYTDAGHALDGQLVWHQPSDVKALR